MLSLIDRYTVRQMYSKNIEIRAGLNILCALYYPRKTNPKRDQ